MRALALVAVLLVPLVSAGAEPAHSPIQRYAISLHRETEQRSSDGGSGSSSDSWGWTEKVVARNDAGVELVYDLPVDATADDRAREWQLPARVVRSPDGKLQLLNRAELEIRLTRWLQRAKWTREICGQWIFTWNAFHIDCDPLAVLVTLESLDMGPQHLREGALYRDSNAQEAVPLKAFGAGKLVAELALEPEATRRGRAEMDVVVGGIMNQPVTSEAALAKHAAEEISGTITVEIELDPTGLLRRRTKITRVKIANPDGKTESHSSTETLDRRLLD